MLQWFMKINLENTAFNKNIEEVETKNIPDCDVLVGGFPCQDYSRTSLRHNKDLKTGGVG